MRNAALVFWLLLLTAPTWADLSPLQGVRVGKVSQHPAPTRRDPALEKAIAAAVNAPDGTEVSYLYAPVRLRESGPPQTLVLLGGEYFCGTGGCSGLIFDGAPKYRLLLDSSCMRPDWLVTNARHHGLRDIVCRVSGGGEKAHYVRLAFNGSTYPMANDAPSVPPSTTLSGDLFLVETKEGPDRGYLTFTLHR